VLLLNDHLGWGNQVHGVTRLFELWARHLDGARYRASVCVLRHQPALAAALLAAGVPVTFLGRGRYDPLTLSSLLRLMRSEGVSLVHAQGYGGATFGRLAGRVARVPVIVHFHDTTPYYPLPQRLADRLLGRLTSRYLAVSETVRAWWAARCGLDPAEVLVLPNCTSLERFRPPTAAEAGEARRALGLADNAPVVGTVTRLFEEKGTRFLLEAIPSVLKARPDTRFVIVGDGPLREALKARAEALEVGGRVVFTGYRADVSRCLAAFDLFVLTSQFAEGGAPLPVLEAMAMEKPVVVTDLVEIVEDGVSGLRVPRRDPVALAKAIVSVLAKPEEAARLAARGHAVARAHDAPAYVERLQAVYDSVFA
jgi:glycosyltransferase involved in cell wall biosynthesis